MTPLSPRAKRALKIGLAMTIAYGLAMRMSWTNPKWAAMSVGMISIVGVGQSLNKATLRLMGTLISAILAFIYLSFFVQDRWALLAVLTVHIAICSYMITGKRGSYGWFVGGYVCLIISAGGHGSADQIFHTAVARAGETILGIIIYTLISVFIWPEKNQEAMEAAAKKLFSTQVTLYDNCRNLLTGAQKTTDPGPSMVQEAQLLSQFEQVLDAAATDSYEVSEVRQQWYRFLNNSRDLMETLERLRISFPELQNLNLPQLLPNLKAFCSDLDMRFAEIKRMLALNESKFKPQIITLETDQEKLHLHSTFEKAALAVCKTELSQLERLSRSLFATVADIRGFAESASAGQANKTEPENTNKQSLMDWFAIDTERVIVSLRAVMTLWLSFLVWIYIDPPGGGAFVQLSTTVALIAVKMPTTPPRALFVPYLSGVLFGGILYLFVMPQLSSFWQIGSLIFIYFFATNYIYWKPSQGLAHIGSIIGFLYFTFLNNHMVYEFTMWSDSLIVITSAIGLTVVCSYIPASPRPEKIFLRLINQFFKHCEFLISRSRQELGKKPGFIERWKTALYNNDLAQLPVKLATWGAKIDHQSFPNNSPEQVQTLVTALHELALKVKAVTAARQHPQAAYLVNELRDDVRAWRQLIEQECELMATNPQTAIKPSLEIQEQLAKQFTNLETRTREIFAHLEKTVETRQALSLHDPDDYDPDPDPDPDDYENFYRLLGSYRELSKSGGKVTRLAGKIDWAHWQEARF